MLLSHDYADAYNFRGWFYDFQSDRARAVADFDSTIELFDKEIRRKHDLADAYDRQAEAYVGKGDYDRAIAASTKPFVSCLISTWLIGAAASPF
jgi:tetratricopeptide (TPR) repeat protein